ncbi:hypothetical protein [Tenacibaculum finnmarkense]|uniref:hypothetical protein n=1 Tax=Tenacibaculum finnmarkense TaxID=2781243 RepID=UPI00207AEB6B|nr:hypothetical protein [Tenacibaculum finnmarkense]MCM8906796.1 hypothetical protein [Tenacibaculum finnmarkense genomovar finnmarkense]
MLKNNKYMWGLKNFFRKNRKDVLKDKSIDLFNQITNDYHSFTIIEQAEVIKNLNIAYLTELDIQYNKAFCAHKEISKAKEMIK